MHPVFPVLWAGCWIYQIMLKDALACEFPQSCSEVLDLEFYFSVSSICQVRQRLMSVVAVCFVRANISASLRTLTTSVLVNGTATNTPGKPCPLKQASKSRLCFLQCEWIHIPESWVIHITMKNKEIHYESITFNCYYNTLHLCFQSFIFMVWAVCLSEFKLSFVSKWWHTSLAFFRRCFWLHVFEF